MSTTTRRHPKGADPEAEVENPDAVAPDVPATTAENFPALTGYEGDEDAGLGDLTPEELLVPFIRIIQALSPQCDPSAPEYDERARAGMILNTATGDLYPGNPGVLFVPVKREQEYLEWVPRDAGGGLVGRWDVGDPRIGELRAKQGKFGKLHLDSGNELVQTFSLFGLVAPVNPKDPTAIPDVWDRAIVGFTSTQIGAYKSMMTRLSAILGKLPMFAYAWQMKTIPQKNKKGSFSGWAPSLLGGTPPTAKVPPGSPTHLAARSFKELLKTGGARADYEGNAPTGEHDDEEVPF